MSDRPYVRSAEAGYTMAALMVAVTILTILTGAALPVWSQRIQREKEEELIFRGWQYAEAIRIFQQRQGRLPTKLDELLEIEPRSIRQLWKDPMTEDGEWGVVIQVGGGPGQPPQQGQVPRPNQGQEDPNGRPVNQQQGGQDGVCVGASGSDEQGGAGGGRRGRGGSGGQPQLQGPIIGVCSRSNGESLKTLFGEDHYDSWHFTVNKLAAGRIQGVGPEGLQRSTGGPQPVTGETPALPRAEWIGRPFREGLQPEGAPQNGGLPTGSDGQRP